MHYVVGLGNPGTKYEHTRHNVGRKFLYVVAHTEQLPEWSKDKGAQALSTRGVVASHPVVFLLPETFMNKSGESVRYLVNKKDMEPDKLIVVYDDVDLPIGDIKVSFGRGSGGHNGVASVIQALGTKDFTRIRIGVASKGLFGTVKRPSGEKLSGHVLGKFSKREEKKLEEAFAQAHDALVRIVRDGAERAMSVCN